MKNMNKLAVLLLILAVLMGAFAVAAFADTGLTLAVETVSAKPGEEVTVNVNMTENDGMTNYELYVDYDHDTLELKSIDANAELGFLTAVNLSKDKDGKNCGFITAARAEACTETAATLFTVTFTVKENATGTAQVKVLNQKFNLVDALGLDKLLPFGNTAGGVEIVNEIPTIDKYEFGQSVQIRLIEPWGLKVNALVYPKGTTINQKIDYHTLEDYGFYFIRESDLDVENPTQDTVTAADIINDADATLMGKDHVSEDGSFLTATFDEAIYTYQMNDTIYVLFYAVDEDGIQYAPVRARNIKSLISARKDDTVNFKNPLERDVYAKMEQLYQDVTVYRSAMSGAAEIKQGTLLKDSDIDFRKVAANSSYNFGNSVQIRIVEPWGLRFNGLVYTGSSTNNVIDYNKLEDYGVIVYYGNLDQVPSKEELMTNENAYVYSKKDGTAQIDGSFIYAIYNVGIFTYQLDTDAYVMVYVKDADGYHFGDVKVRNIRDLADARKNDTVNFKNESERAVYADMVAMYDAITAYRDDYYSKIS